MAAGLLQASSATHLTGRFVSPSLASGLIAARTASPVLALEVADGMVRNWAHDDPITEIDNDDLAGLPTGQGLGGDGDPAIVRHGHPMPVGCPAAIAFALGIVGRPPTGG
jgi:hypothetical protein